MTGEKRKKAFVLYLLSAVARAVITSEREGGVGGGRGGDSEKICKWGLTVINKKELYLAQAEMGFSETCS